MIIYKQSFFYLRKIVFKFIFIFLLLFLLLYNLHHYKVLSKGVVGG
jgi:hypothetical protein